MAYHQNTRIKFEMTGLEVLMAMSGTPETGYNPGALRVCKDLLQLGDDIDPDNAFGGLGALLNLDSLGIYAERVWMFYKDVCREDYATMLAVARAAQLGILDAHKLDHAIDNRGAGIDVPAILAAVKERLPAF